MRAHSVAGDENARSGEQIVYGVRRRNDLTRFAIATQEAALQSQGAVGVRAV
jgi:hypothetical protein